MKNDFAVIFKGITKEEFAKFGDYLSSPYFKIPARMLRLYSLIEKCCDIPCECGLSRGEIAAHFYGKSGAKENTSVRKLISEFKKYFKDFTAQIIYDNDKLIKGKCELKRYKQNFDAANYKIKADELVKFIKTNQIKDDEYYYNLLDIRNNYYSLTGASLDDISSDLSFELNDYLDKYFASLKLFLFQRFSSFEYISNINLEKAKTFQDALFRYIEENKNDLEINDPEIYLRYTALLLDIHGFKQELYDKYITVLNNSSKKLNINENGFYITLLNIISKFINHGEKDLDRKIVEIAGILVEKKIIQKLRDWLH